MGLSARPDGLGSWLVGGAIKGMLSTITSWVDDGAAQALRLTGSMLSSTSNPGLLSPWFSTTYWRVAALSALLTVPFLFAAAVHALVRSDLALLGRAAFGYLPLAMVGITIAAPVTTLLLSATDEMCAIVASAAGNDDGAALFRAAEALAGITAVTGDPLLGFFIGLLAVAATIGLWIELLIRAAAVDVIVLMLPLFFAAMVWPARRVWAIRAIETLISLVLSKFAVVAVFTLGGAAFGGSTSGVSSALVGATLILLAVLSPWALLRLLPLHEVAAAAAGGLSQAPRSFLRGAGGSLYDGARATGGDSDGAGRGLGVEDDSDDASTRALAFGAAGSGGARLGAAAATGAGPAGGEVAVTDGSDAGGSARPSDGNTTTTGPSAIERSVRRAAQVAGSDGVGPSIGHAPGTTVFPRRAPDDRPPIDEPFGPGEWEPFVIGEEGDDVMRPPRFASRTTGPEPDPIGAEVARDPGSPLPVPEDRPAGAIEPLGGPTGPERP
jgi:hypothetical protein